LDEPAALAWSHGKLLGLETDHTRLIEKARQNKMKKNPCLPRRYQETNGAAIQSEIEVRVNKVVQLAFSQLRATGSQQDIMVSPASQRCSSYTSTVAPNVAVEHPEINPANDVQ